MTMYGIPSGASLPINAGYGLPQATGMPVTGVGMPQSAGVSSYPGYTAVMPQYAGQPLSNAVSGAALNNGQAEAGPLRRAWNSVLGVLGIRSSQPSQQQMILAANPTIVEPAPKKAKKKKAKKAKLTKDARDMTRAQAAARQQQQLQAQAAAQAAAMQGNPALAGLQGLGALGVGTGALGIGMGAQTGAGNGTLGMGRPQVNASNQSGLSNNPDGLDQTVANRNHFTNRDHSDQQLPYGMGYGSPYGGSVMGWSNPYGYTPTTGYGASMTGAYYAQPAASTGGVSGFFNRLLGR